MTRFRSLLAGAGFRFAMLFTAAFMACVGVIGVTARRAVVAELEAQARRHAEAEAGALVDEFVHGGRPDLDAALAGRLRDGKTHYRYAMVDGPGLPEFPAPAISGTSSDRGISVLRRLDDGSGIVVTDDLSRVESVGATLDRAFLSALGVAAVLGLCTGGLLSGALLGRLDKVTRAADAVAAGDLDSRMPLLGTGDEFDRLAATLNRMLDRIVVLLTNLRQVSTDVAHDLRTPMSRLRQDLEAVHRRGVTVGEYRGAVARALTDIDGILDIFAAVLRIAQLESGMRRSELGRVDLSAIVTEVADAYGAAAADEGRKLATDIAPGISVQGDRDLLVQLMANLVENALQHTPLGSGLRVGAAPSGRASATAWVADEGPGIPVSERGNVLRRFYRLERSRSDQRHGLGLSLVAAIADLHDARLLLADAAPGLKVEIVFPSTGIQQGP